MKAKSPFTAFAVGILTAVLGGGAYADHPSIGFGTHASGPIVTVSAATLPKDSMALGVQTEYTKSNRYSDDELTQLAGKHVHAHSTDYLLSPSIGWAYGVTDDFTLGLRLPYVHRENLRTGHHGHGPAGNTVEERGDSKGVGDLTILGKYRLSYLQQSEYQTAVLFGIEAPTGKTHETDRHTERFDTEHQPGSGSWDPLLGVALTRRFDRFSVDASLLYVFSTKGVQDTKLGDRARYSLGGSYRLGSEAHHHGAGTSTHHTHTAWDLILELNGVWEGKQKIGGVSERDSGGNLVYLSPGVRVVLANGWSGNLAVGFPVVQNIRRSHPENDYRIVAGIGKVL